MYSCTKKKANSVLPNLILPIKNSLKLDFMMAADSHLNLLLSEDLNQLVLKERLSIPFQSSESF